MASDDSLDRVVAEYLQATERGEAPARAVLVQRYPHLAEGLNAFFADLDRFGLAPAPRAADPEQTQGLKTQGLTGPAGGEPPVWS